MAIGPTHEESETARALQDTGIPPQEALIAVLMFTRGHARPETELVNILDLYPGLEIAHEVQQTFQVLKAKGWLITVKSFGQDIIKAAPDLQDKMARHLNNQALIERLAQSRLHLTNPPDYIRLLGPMTSENVYGTFIDLLGRARTEICLPMLVTPPYPTTAATLQERASRGVHIRLLLASPDVAVKIRGETTAEKALKAIKEWKSIAQHYPTIEIRISHHCDDMCHLATSWTLDRHFLRYDVYDPKQQRSLAGYMIEFDSRTGFDLNIVNWFQSCFDEAWNRAQPVGAPRRMWWIIKKNWQWWAFILTALITLVLGTSIWGGIMGSVSATFLCNALVESWSAIRAFIHSISQ